MVQPKTPPLSIRPGAERLARIDAYAKDHLLSRHLAILLMLDEGYRSLTYVPEPMPLPGVLRSGSVTPVDYPRLAAELDARGKSEPMRLPRAPIGSLAKKPGKAKR